MNSTVRKDILAILAHLLEDIEKPQEERVIHLKELSDRTIHDASIFQDQDSTSIAIVVYAISKLLEQGMVLHHSFKKTIRSAYNQLLEHQYGKYRKRVRYLYVYISKQDSRLNVYIEKVLKHARLKKGSRIHDHGISMARTAEILGLSQWELSNYIGRRRVEDEQKRIPISRRLKFARRLFEVKL